MTAAAQFVERYSANVPMGHMGQDSKEVELTSAASHYATGHNLAVDGGLTAC